MASDLILHGLLMSNKVDARKVLFNRLLIDFLYFIQDSIRQDGTEIQADLFPTHRAG